MPTKTKALTLFAVLLAAGVAAAQDGGSADTRRRMTLTDLKGPAKAYFYSSVGAIRYRIERTEGAGEVRAVIDNVPADSTWIMRVRGKEERRLKADAQGRLSWRETTDSRDVTLTDISSPSAEAPVQDAEALAADTTAPSAPQGMTVAAGAAIAISWIAPADEGGSGIMGYQIERSQDGRAFAPLAWTSATSYTDSDVSGVKHWWYRVRAQDGAEAGNLSPWGDAVDPIATEGAFTLGATPVSSNEIDLSWGTPSQGTPSSWQVQRKPAGGAFQPIGEVPPDQHQYHDTSGLTAGNQYTYQVGAVSGADIALSNEVSTYTLAGTEITLTAEAGSSGVTNLSWTNNTVVGLYSYKVQRKSGSMLFSDVASLSWNTTAWQDTGAAGGTAYTYRVVGANYQGDHFSNAASATAQAPPAPEPTGLYGDARALQQHQARLDCSR